MTMRLASKARDKAELPAGYQFGDAARWAEAIELYGYARAFLALPFERLPRPTLGSWNVIEGDTH